MRLIRRLALVVAGIAFGVQMTAAAHAGTRVALVIGNGAYQNVSGLGNPVNDANLIATALKTDGFAVTVADDLGHEAFLKTLRAFQNEADNADWAVVYYAGHGIEMAGTNYLIPVDAKLAQDRDVPDETVSLDRVMTAVEGARTLRMVVLDACRNNPFLAAMKRSSGAGRAIGRGLALVEPEQATLVAYAAKAGSIAADGAGADSPFATALAKHLTEPGVEVDKLFRLVRDDVLDATGKKQEPFVYGSLPGQDFYFQPSAPVGGNVAEPDQTAADYQAAAAVGTPAAWDLFLKKHGAETDNFYVGLAKQNQQKLAALTPPAGEPAKPKAALIDCSGALVASVGDAGVAAAAERCLKPKDVFRDCADICPEMVVIPAGSFTMGSPASEKGRYPNEGPQHNVTISAVFAVGKFSVTRGQFAEFVNDTGYDTGSRCWTFENGKWEERSGRSWRNPGFKQDDTHPAVCISWDDAKAYVAWLSRKTGKGYRLLTEAEFEYADRAGTTTRYSFGNDESGLCGNGNGADQTAKRDISGVSGTVAPCSDGYAYTAPVGSFAANDFGLYDMIGNVWEWTEDCYHDSYSGASQDGSAWTTGECKERAGRGGAWYSSPGFLRAAERGASQPGVRFGGNGFRVARTL